MLEYLFNMIQRNMILIFSCVLGLSIASAFSKKIKILFITILVASASYFALLCFYRLGIGIEALYNYSCKVVLWFCEWIEHYQFLFSGSDVFYRILKIMSFNSINNLLYNLELFVLFIVCIFLLIDLYMPVLRSITLRKIEIKRNYVMKPVYYTNTITEKQPRFILNSILRC